MKKFIFLIFVLLRFSIYAQIGIGTITPNAAIEVASSTEGFLLPRVELTSKKDPTILTPTVSEIVYNTATDGVAPYDVKPGFYFWTGTAWMELDNASETKNWRTTGNAEASATIDFAGTVDDVDINFRRFNIKSGTLSNTNTAFGSNSLSVVTAVFNNITPTINTAFGAGALASNTNATGNTAFGFNALRESTTAEEVNNFKNNTDNTAFGFETLKNNNTQGYFSDIPSKGNTAIGTRALRANTRGANDTAIGTNALIKNELGSSNTAVGAETLSSNINFSSNVALGSGALKSNDNEDNTALGYASSGLSPGVFRTTAIGSNSLGKNAGGNRCTGFGYKAMFESRFGSDNTVAGALAMENGSGNHSTFIGYNAWATPPPPASQSITNDSVGIGYGCLPLLDNFAFIIGIGKGAEAPREVGDAIRIGNTAITYAGIQVPWTTTSDRRWKTDITTSDLGIDFIQKLRPVSYIRNNDKGKKLEYGFIAQELEQAFTSSKVSKNSTVSTAGDGTLGVRYNDLLAPMVKALQQQQIIIERLITRIEELKKNKNKK
ncbi:MAG TPA: tail fiber domain-containing protein [Flavobacterium sp.]|jgi:hypothetical protein